jgi:hypothetical protein
MAPFPVEAPEMPAQFSAIWFAFITLDHLDPT